MLQMCLFGNLVGILVSPNKLQKIVHLWFKRCRNENLLEIVKSCASPQFFKGRGCGNEILEKSISL